MAGMGRWGVGSLIGAVLTVASPAHAQEEDAAASAPHRAAQPLEIGAGGFVQMGFGNVCRRDGDAEGCTSGAGLAGLQLTPRWRFSRLFSVGILGAIGWTLGNEGTAGSGGAHSDYGLRGTRLEGELRYHPFGESTADPWLGGDFGLVTLTDSVDDYGTDGGHLGHSSVTRAGPRGGFALGVDFRTTSFLALGFELRGGVEAFGNSRPLLVAARDLHAREYGTLTIVSLGVGGTFLAAP